MSATYGVRLKDGGWFNAPIPSRTSERHAWAVILENQNREVVWDDGSR